MEALMKRQRSCGTWYRSGFEAVSPARALLSLLAIALLISLPVEAQQGSATAAPANAGSQNGRILRLAFDILMVSNIEKSIEFYKAIGFSLEGSSKPAWKSDQALNRLYNSKGASWRTAVLTIKSATSSKPFMLYLREYKGIERKNWGHLKPWDPVSNHIGVIVPDAEALWAKLGSEGLLKPLTWGGKLIPRPGQTKGSIAYISDPDGISVEIVGQRHAMPATADRPATPADALGLSHVGLVVINSDRSKAFYGTQLGAQFPSTPSQWLSGDFYDSVVGAHGNILRLFMGTFPEADSPGAFTRLELVEFQNAGKKDIAEYSLSDVAVNCLGFEVEDLDAIYARLTAAGVTTWSDGGIVTLSDGTRAVIVRNPDVGGFVELFEK
jgi:catechol 2,3-dioxygenase-like lactoylglutathione lyase family enzyme